LRESSNLTTTDMQISETIHKVVNFN